MIVILGAPGGGTSFFTKFLRFNGFYAGKSIEDGRDIEEHIGYLYRRKWHESLVYADHFCKPILSQIGLGKKGYQTLFSSDYRNVLDHIQEAVQKALPHFLTDNYDSVIRMYNDEFPDKTIPHGFKNPRSFLIIPFIKKAYPNAKLLTVQRSMNPDPSSQGPEGKAFAKRIKEEDYIKGVYGHEDDYRFQFEDFLNVEEVNKLLTFVGLKTLTQEELYEQLNKLQFDANKIGQGNVHHS